MEKTIQDKLFSIAQHSAIELLFACESGSRAWGFPSLDSDYDVRFIYVQKPEKYMSVTAVNEDLESPIHDNLDICGWDLRKVLRLLYKSNVTPFEWLQSPIVYSKNVAFVDSFNTMLKEFYCPRIHVHHYLGLVKGRLPYLDDEQMKLKSFFYMLRSLLSAKWNLTFGEFAPMELGALSALLPNELKIEVSMLQGLKLAGYEHDACSISAALKLYFKYEYTALFEQVKDVSKKSNNTALLDDYFIKTIM